MKKTPEVPEEFDMDEIILDSSLKKRGFSWRYYLGVIIFAVIFFLLLYNK